MHQALAEERPARLGAATASGANEGLALREAELDGIEVRAIGWPGPEGGPGSLDGALDAGDRVGPERVGNDDVAGLQGRHQDLFDGGAEALAIDRAGEDPRCGQPRDPPRGEQRAGLPAPAGGVVVDARAARCPAVPPKQIGGDAGFVQKHAVGDIPGRRRRCFSSRTHEPLTRYFAATSAAFIPASLSSSARSRRSIE